MVLVQGLLLGRVLLNVMNRQEGRNVVITSSIPSLSRVSQKRQKARRLVRNVRNVQSNPYEQEEFLNRIGGTSIRNLSEKNVHSLQHLVNDEETWYDIF